MPFKSEAQRRFMYSQHPELAKEFEAATPKGKHLPEHVPQKMDEGGLVSMIRHVLLGDKGDAAVKTDANDARSADAIDPVVSGSTDTAKGYADGGAVDKNEPGLQDVSATDFLLPYLLGAKLAPDMAEGVEAKLADEAGSLFPRKAPLMEDALKGATTKDMTDPNAVEVYVKGIQKGVPGGSGDIKIYGVKGNPSKLKELFGDEAPASVPENILRQKGLLPSEGPSIPQPAPNAYSLGGYTNGNQPSNTTPTPFAEGGKVERSSLEHPTPNAMMARAMNDGGYPHVTFLENETPEKVREVTHLAAGPSTETTTTETGEKTNPAHNYAGGGVASNFELMDGEKGKKAPEGDVHVNRESHMSVPIKSKDTEFHLKSTPEAMAAHEVGNHYKIVQDGKLTSQEGDMERFRVQGAPKVEGPNGTFEVPMMNEGGKTPHFLEGLKKGALHEQLGVSEDKKIPAKKLEKAANSDNETLRKRAQFAINAKKWHHAEGGLISGLKKTGEPEKSANIEPSHEEKLKAIYKAMGMKKYADGGAVDGDGDASQLPGQSTAPPSQSSPDFWDQIKAALQKLGAPISAAANIASLPAQAASAMAPTVAPVAAGAINRLAGTSLPVPPLSAPPTPLSAPQAPAVDKDFMDKLNAGTALTPAPTAQPAQPTARPSAAPNLSNLFNQDTSKLTEGVNPEDRQALVDKLQGQQHGLGSVIAQAVAGLGDALAAKGGREQHSLQNIFSMQKEQRDEALANFDKARQDRIQKLALQTQMGNNAIQQLAAQDAYGVDDNLNAMLGAPKGTAHKDLPLYFQMKTSQIAQQEKDADLYLKAHAQAASEVDAAAKNASLLSIKPSAAQLQASGNKLADNYYNRAKGNILVKPSDGGPAQWIPARNISKAKQMDPNLQIIPG